MKTCMHFCSHLKCNSLSKENLLGKMKQIIYCQCSCSGCCLMVVRINYARYIECSGHVMLCVQFLTHSTDISFLNPNHCHIVFLENINLNK